MALAALGGASPLAGQRVWTNTLYPYAYYTSVDGFWIAGHFSEYSPLGFAPRPEANGAAVTVDGAASTQGSYLLLVDAEAPALWDGWRVGLTLSANRDNRLGFFGPGNATVNDADSVGPGSPYFYKVSRSRQYARLTVQRRVIGALRVLAGAQLEHTDFRALPGASAFSRDLTAGVVDSTRIPFTDELVRAGLVFDTRDVELVPHSGVLLEALYAAGRGYNRRTASAKVYVNPTEKLVIAGRLAAEAMGGRPPLAAELEMESSELPYVAVGGYRSLRGYYDARFTGPGKLLGGLEARYGLLWAPTLFELDLVAFYDAGRVFDAGQSVTLTTKGLHQSGGGALGFRFGRNTVLTFGYGRGGEGGQILFGTSWSF
ncbi:MAG TPA: BamA/TamA family outer membrane protein [Gemmatimonadales bacterium]|nr:BamA/TamA family outer membrane protein [Gemmatimonadales bacterium]